MIRKLEAADAPQLFDVMSNVYATHSFLDQGIEAYQAALETGSYVSLGEFEGSTLRAHAGYNAAEHYALINALVVDPVHRSTGLGAQVFDARLQHIINSGRFAFVVGYSMMQHAKSQRLYDEAFKPIGIDIGYPDIYHNGDAQYNKGAASNAELVLCRRLQPGHEAVSLQLANHNRSLAVALLGSVGVSARFEAGLESTEAFLGFHPSKDGRIFVPAYLEAGVEVDFSSTVTSSPERQSFVDAIRDHHAT